MTALQLPFDLRFAWAGAKLTFPFIRRGIVPEGSYLCSFRAEILISITHNQKQQTAASTYLLPRLIGQSRANSLFLTGGTFSPNSPQIQSLYHEILPTREEVFPKALALAKELAIHAAPKSVTYTKGLIQHPGDSVEENHLLDSRALKIVASGEDAEEGARSFFERRPPRWKDSSEDKEEWYPWVRPRYYHAFSSKTYPSLSHILTVEACGRQTQEKQTLMSVILLIFPLTPYLSSECRLYSIAALKSPFACNFCTHCWKNSTWIVWENAFSVPYIARSSSPNLSHCPANPFRTQHTVADQRYFFSPIAWNLM